MFARPRPPAFGGPLGGNYCDGGGPPRNCCCWFGRPLELIGGIIPGGPWLNYGGMNSFGVPIGGTISIGVWADLCDAADFFGGN